MTPGLIAVAALAALLVVLVIRLTRPGGGIYINEKQANALRRLHKPGARGGPMAQK